MLKTQNGGNIICHVCNECHEKVVNLQQSNHGHKIGESISYLRPYLNAEIQNVDTAEGKKFKSYIRNLIENKKEGIHF